MVTYPLEQWMNEADTARIMADINHIRSDIADIKGEMRERFVTKDQFEPVRLVVYGLVGVLLLAVIGALLALVITSGGAP